MTEDGETWRGTAKLRAPVLTHTVLRRPELEKLLDDVFGRRLATVTAGAGFGKSTLLADWSAELSCAWYTISEADVEPPVLARGLAEALAREVPQIAGILRMAAAGGTHDAFGALVSEELDGVLDRDLILVLDDVHEIEPGAASARLLESLCRHAPPLLHLVLSSRAPPPFAIERLRGRGEVLSIGGPDLAFTVDEVAALLQSWLDEDAAGLAPALHQACDGWPVATRLAVEALRVVPPDERGAALDRIRSPDGPLFDYLAEEVFERESEDVRLLVSRVSPLDRFTAPLCTELGLRAPPAMLDDLVRRGLLTRVEEDDGTWFVLHALLREFALKRLSPGEAVLADVRRCAAAWLESHGDLLEALLAYSAAADHAQVARLLWERRHDLLEVGSSGAMVSTAARLPEPFRTARVDLAAGYAHVALGEAAVGLEYCLRAAGSFEPTDPLFAFQLGNALHEGGRDDEAFAALSKVAAKTPSWETAMIATIRALTLCARGEIDEARAVAESALAAARQLGDPTPETEAHIALALVERRLGDYSTAEVHLDAALAAADREGNLSGFARARAVRACLLHEQDRYEEALAEFEIALRMSELAGYGSFQTQILCRRGRTRLVSGRLDEALADFNEAAAAGERRGSGRTIDAYTGLGDLYLARGDASLAATAYERALGQFEDSAGSGELVAVLCGLARVVAVENPERADELAGKALQLARANPPTGALLPAGWVSRAHEPTAAALLARGWLELTRGDADAGASTGAELFAEAVACGDRALLAEALELRAGSEQQAGTRSKLLEEAVTIWRELEAAIGQARCELALARVRRGAAATRAALGAEERLRALGVRPNSTTAGLLTVIPGAGAAPVAIETLGTFRVLRRGQTVHSSEWRSKKARDLLKMLVARRGRPLPRQSMMETLWPGEDGAKVANRLSVALSTIRSLLDPDRSFEPDYFVVAGDEGVRLELAHVDVDVESFLTGATTGLALFHDGRVDDARSVLTRAQAAYGGEFLEDEPYHDWAVALREEARNAFIDVARRLADDAAARGDHDGTVRHLLRILERDPYDERAHLAVVSTHSAARRHGDARRAFGIYAARMEEIGLESASFPSSGARGHQ